MDTAYLWQHRLTHTQRTILQDYGRGIVTEAAAADALGFSRVAITTDDGQTWDHRLTTGEPSRHLSEIGRTLATYGGALP